MTQQTVTGFFDPNNVEHLKAYAFYQKHDRWPFRFYDKYLSKLNWDSHCDIKINIKIINTLLKYQQGVK
jgi:hypothetical protein